jgi:DNA polymerase-3 subunit beta
MSVSFTADRKELLKAVEDAGRGCSSGGHVPILRGLLVECEKDRAHFSGVDMDVYVSASCAATTKGFKDTARFVLEDARKTAAILKTLDDGPVEVSASKEAVAFEQAGTTLRLGVLAEEDFPKGWNVVAPDTAFEVRVADFLGAWKRVGKMYSGDESRPVLTAVHVRSEQYRVFLEATDSFRLAFDWIQAKLSGTGTASALIRGGTLELAARFAKRDADGLVSFKFDADVAVIEVDGVHIASRLVQGQFPDVAKLLPDKFEGDFDLDAAAAVKACRRVEKLKGTRFPMRLTVPTVAGSVRFWTFDDAKLVDTDQKVPSARASKNKAEFDIGLNPGFFADAIESLDSDTVTVKYISPQRPLLVVNGKEDTGVLQMPIKLA